MTSRFSGSYPSRSRRFAATREQPDTDVCVRCEHIHMDGSEREMWCQISTWPQMSALPRPPSSALLFPLSSTPFSFSSLKMKTSLAIDGELNARLVIQLICPLSGVFYRVLVRIREESLQALGGTDWEFKLTVCNKKVSVFRCVSYFTLQYFVILNGKQETPLWRLWRMEVQKFSSTHLGFFFILQFHN